MKDTSARIVVAAKPANLAQRGSSTWMALQYVLGLQRLGHEVLFLEPCNGVAPKGANGRHANGGRPNGAHANGASTKGGHGNGASAHGSHANRSHANRSHANRKKAGSKSRKASSWDTDAVAYFLDVIEHAGLEGSAAMVCGSAREGVGMSYDDVAGFCSSADILLNLSGALQDDELFESIQRRVHIDMEPDLTGGPDQRAHDHYFTTSLAGGNDEAADLPSGQRWQPILQPVVLERCEAHRRIRYHALTSLGGCEGAGRNGSAARAGNGAIQGVAKYLHVPERARARFLLAPPETPRPEVLDALRTHGWGVVDPLRVAGTPDGFQSFVQGSIAEFSMAREHVDTDGHSGWPGNRSACYLASGRPVLAQDTGFGQWVPTGEGVLSFRTEEEAVAGVEELHRDYKRHALAARAVAETHFDSDRILPALVDEVCGG